MHVESADALAEWRARQLIAAALAAAFSETHDQAAVGIPAETGAALQSAWRLAALPHAAVEASDLQSGEALPAEVDFRPVIRWLCLDPQRRQRAAHSVFGLVISRPCAPCETEHLRSSDGFHRAQVMADIAGFYRAFGVGIDSRRPQRPDHLAVELEFVALLLEKVVDALGDPSSAERTDVCQRALASFVQDHLTTWLPGFGQLVARRAEDVAGAIAEESERDAVRLLGDLGRVLCAWIAAERCCAGIAPSRGTAAQALPQAAEPNDACESCECL